MTWPPAPIDGFAIPDYHARDDSVWPTELSTIKTFDRRSTDAAAGRESSGRLRASEGLRMTAALHRLGALRPLLPMLIPSLARVTLTRDRRLRDLAMRHAKQSIACELALGLRREYEPDIFAFVTFLVDYVSHRFWRFHEPDEFTDTPPSLGRRYEHTVRNAYIQTDRMLGRMRRELPSNSIIAVVSEHGMAAEVESTEVGQWYFGIQGTRVADFVELSEQVKTCPVARWVAYRALEGSTLPSDTAERLRSIEVVETGLPLFQVIEHSNEVVIKLSLEATVDRYRAGDLSSLHLRFRESRCAFLDLATPRDLRRSAMHAKLGVFMLSGPGIAADTRIEGARIIDIAPTLLRAIGLGRAIDPGVEGVPLDVFG